MNFRTYLHAVGTGVKGNRDLTYEEAQDMMRQILDQSVSPEEIAAFLLGWRLKPETIDEFRGALHVCDSYITPQKVENSIELGYPFDGKAKNPYIVPLVAKILESTDLHLVLTGDLLQPAKGGITTRDIMQQIEPGSHLHYFDRKDFFPELHNLTQIRQRLGLRTAFNTIEKLTYIAESPYALTGVFHKPYVQKYIDTFADRYKRFALIQGNEGTPELFSKGRLWIAENGEVSETIIDPEFYGVNYKKSWERITLEESIAQINNPSDEFLKLARLNAAVLLFITGRSDDIGSAYEDISR
ncbi:MAG: glycosyl transferase [Campylobacterota bacterium]|nr:glycosyl transferase [Campylobacterota bacterium]